MVSFENPIFIILLASGACIWLIALYLLRNPPKAINKSYGYRTPKAMKSQEAWDFAQLYGTKKMILGAQIMCVLSIPSLFFQTSEIIGVFVAITIVLLCIIIPIVITERQLKHQF